MRILPLVALTALLAGCATVPQQEDEASSASSMTSAKDESVAYGPCAASRATILASVSSARAAAISRGFTWLDADVPFSETDTYNSYRTDCSGFVSMCWSLRAPGLNTRTLGTKGSGSYKLNTYDELVPADALVRAGHHSVIFLGWNDSAHDGACVLEQSSTKNDMQFRVRLKSQLQGDGFVPMRADEFRGDTRVNAPSETPSPTRPSETDTTGTDTTTNTDTGTGGTDTTKPSSPSTDDTEEADDTTGTGGTGGTSGTGGTNETKACESTSVALVCGAAWAMGIECGRVIDNCGRAVDCTGMFGFGCDSGETCSSNKCTSTCKPKSKADLCYSAQLKTGLECGSVSDGCGGTVDCGELPAFKCGGGGTCGDDHKCKGGTPTSPTTGSSGTTPEAGHEYCEGPQDNPELCPSAPVKGDPGDDEGTAHPSSTRTAASDAEATDKHTRNGAAVASSGCSSAPGGSSSGFGSVVLGFFVLLGARRRRAALR